MKESNITQIPIAGFFGPCKLKDKHRSGEHNSIQDDVYQKIADAGINTIVFSANDYGIPEERQIVSDTLDMCAKYGIRMCVQDSRINGTTDESKILQFIDDYKGHSGFAGVHIKDEPVSESYATVINADGSKTKVADCAEISSVINDKNGILGYMNLLPYWEWLGSKQAYRDYVEEFVNSCKPSVLSMDYYLFDPNYIVTRPGYFWNLSVMREASLKYGIPFWNFIQAGTYWNDGHIELDPTENVIPSEGQMRWNVNTSLAYGAKGIEYFPLIQPFWFAYEKDGKYDFQRNGLIGANGAPTRWYDYAKENNKQISKLGTFLVRAENKGILAVGTLPQVEAGVNKTYYGVLSSLQAEHLSYGAIVGCFEIDGADAFYVVNYHMSAEQKFTMHFNQKLGYRLLSKQLVDISQTEGIGDSCSFTLAPGGGVLVLTEKLKDDKNELADIS